MLNCVSGSGKVILVRANDVTIVIKDIQMYDAEAYELHPASMKYENVKRQQITLFVVVVR